MNLQDMLGESFHEGMTIEEINSVLSTKKFADLSTGKYVDANKYNEAIKAKDAEIANKTKELNARMTEDEKAIAARDADKARIQELEDFIHNQTISSNKDRVESLTSDVRSILGIESTNEEYSKLLDTLSKNETDSARSMASYINKIVKESYEKGQRDANKDNLGKFSDGVGKDASGKENNVGDYGKQLAQSLKPQIDSNLYFKRN